MFDRVLLPTDGSEGTRPAEETAIELAEMHDATLHILYIVDQPATIFGAGKRIPGLENLMDTLEQEAEEATGDVTVRATDRGIKATSAVRCGNLHGAILTYAKEHDIDVIVMGTHGRTGVKRTLLGSVTEAVVCHSEVPVLTVHRDPEE